MSHSHSHSHDNGGGCPHHQPEQPPQQIGYMQGVGSIDELQAAMKQERQQQQDREDQIRQASQRNAKLQRIVEVWMQRKPFEGESAVKFQVPAGCCCHSCDALLADRSSSIAAIVCHPWGPMGGSMHDPQVISVVDTLGRRGGLTTLRFNFRPGGLSWMSAADLRAAWAFLQSLDSPPDKLLLVGYSYGALVAADVAADLSPDLAALVLLAPPLGARFMLPGMWCRDVTARVRGGSARAPVLLLVGGADPFCSKERFTEFAKGFDSACTWRIMHDRLRAGHHVRVHHVNVYQYLDEYFDPWLFSTFGGPIDALGRCDGKAFAQATAGAAAGAAGDGAREENDDEEEDEERQFGASLQEHGRLLRAV
jgi:pimeloyl-ACP methyl ester carboxylesterase